MTVVMGAVVASHAGDLAEAFTIVMLGGLLQIMFGLLRVGCYVTYTPAWVVSGFMSGVGVIILIMQTLPFFGLPTASNGVLGTVQAWSMLSLGAIDATAALLAAGALLLLVHWPSRIARLVPAPLGVLAIGTAVPQAVLAAILMKVGWDIVDWGYLKRMRRAPREKVVVMLVNFGLTVFIDLIMAVAVGIILASFVNSRWLADEQLKGLKQSADADELDALSADEKAALRSVNGRVLVTMLHGSFSYASARSLAHRDTQAVAPRDVVVYDFTHAGYIDPSAALAIEEMIDLSRNQSRHVIVSGLRDQALRALDGMGVLDRTPAEQRFAERKDAIAAAVAFCRRPAAEQNVSA